MPAIPQSNGLVEIHGTRQKERGFCCMKLIKFLVRDNVKDWDDYQEAHMKASEHNCPYKSECNLISKTNNPQVPEGHQDYEDYQRHQEHG